MQYKLEFSACTYMSMHFIGLSRYFTWWMEMYQIKIHKNSKQKFNLFNFDKKFKLKFKKLNFYLLFLWIFIWYISIHQIKYLYKPIKCLEMRAKIKSVRKMNEIFLCIFTYNWKSDIFSTYPNFDNKWFFGYFKSLFIKCHTHMNILSQKYKIKAFW